MSIISVEEEFGKRSSQLNGLYQRTYVRSFIVETSAPQVGPIAVRGASGIPGIGTHYQNGVGVLDPLHEFDNGAFVQEITVEETDSAIEWRVTVAYGPWEPFPSDPTLWKIRVQFGGERTDKVVEFDKDGNPITNSAVDRFVDPVVIDDSIKTMLITRNELVSTFDPDLASTFSDTINGATWNGIPARQAKMGIISTSEEKYDSNGLRWYYTVTYPVQVNRVEWKKYLLDQGYNQLVAGYGSRPQAMKGPDGQPYGEPRALDGAGHELMGGSPVTLPFLVYDEADWSVLAIDMSTRLGL